MSAHGLLLAAGAGRRYGRPKATVADWLPRAVAALSGGGCAEVSVVLGAAPDVDLPAGTRRVLAAGWAEGMGASLRAGLEALSELEAAAVTAAVVHLVDLPDVGAPVVARLLAGGESTDRLARAAYDGRPGHPVLLGRGHWAGVLEGSAGDQGARRYLAARPVELVECGDLATGHDRDAPPPD